jgi:hypothetical protein
MTRHLTLRAVWQLGEGQPIRRESCVVGVLGIDAAWTENEPSGVALIENSQGGWRCVAVTPSYDSFLALAEGSEAYRLCISTALS